MPIARVATMVTAAAGRLREERRAMVKSFMVVYLPSVEHLLERRGVHVARKPSASFLECAIRLEVREGDPRSRPLLGGGTGSWIEGSGCWKSCVGGTFRTSASRSSA